jgi:hypothetical protein
MIVFVAATLISMTKPIQADQGNIEPVEQIRVVPVQRTPESNTIMLSIAMPKNGEVKMKNPIWVQFRLDGYPLGAGSPSTRTDEVAVSKMGQTLHVVVDNYPYFAVNEPSIDPFNEDGYYYDTRYKFEIPFRLNEGLHTLRMFPARSYGESLKNENTFQVSYFYVGNRGGGVDTELDKPYLTYNEPSDQLPLKESQPILLDFYITNTELSPDGYKVLLTVDGKIKRSLSSWQPYYIYGLKKGKHTIRLQLVDPRGQTVKGSFNDVERTIRVQ